MSNDLALWLSVPLDRGRHAWMVQVDVPRGGEDLLLGEGGSVRGVVAGSLSRGVLGAAWNAGVRLQRATALPGVMWGPRLEYAVGLSWGGHLGAEVFGSVPARGPSWNAAAFPVEVLTTGRVEIGSHLAVRLGGYYQSSAYPENHETFSLFAPFSQQFGVGAGITWNALKILDIHLSYMHIFQNEVRVNQGIVQQMTPVFSTLDPDTGDPTEIAVGNIANSGVYDVSLNLIGISVEGHF